MTLSWNDKKTQLNFKEFPKGFEEATVKDLKEKCKVITEVPIALMKLQVSGGKIVYYRMMMILSSLTCFFFF